jgi:hypothetical protein
LSECKGKKSILRAFSAFGAKKVALFFGEKENYCNFTTNLD